MRHCNDSRRIKGNRRGQIRKGVRRFLKEEDGFLSFEWSTLMFITLLLIVVLLPDTINIGRTMFAGHAASAEAIKQVENQGQMTSAIASIVVDYLEDRGFEECGYASNQVRNCYEIYGTSDQRGLNSENPSVTAMVVTKYRPFILHLVPNMRWGDRIAFEDGIVSMNSVRVGSAASFIRE